MSSPVSSCECRPATPLPAPVARCGGQKARPPVMAAPSIKKSVAFVLVPTGIIGEKVVSIAVQRIAVQSLCLCEPVGLSVALINQAKCDSNRDCPKAHASPAV